MIFGLCNRIIELVINNKKRWYQKILWMSEIEKVKKYICNFVERIEDGKTKKIGKYRYREKGKYPYIYKWK